MSSISEFPNDILVNKILIVSIVSKPVVLIYISNPST